MTYGIMSIAVLINWEFTPTKIMITPMNIDLFCEPYTYM